MTPGRPRRTRTVALLAVALLAGCGAAPRTISESSAGAHEATLAPFGDRLAVAWYDTRHGRAEVYVRLLDARGRPVAPEWRLTRDEEDSYEGRIDVLGDVLAVAWYGKAHDGRLTARLGLWDGDGAVRWLRELASPGRNPVVRADGDTLFAAWIQGDAGDEAVWAAWWDAGGHELVAPRRLAPASETTWNLNADVAGGTAWVVFDAEIDTRSSELVLARMDRDDVVVLPLTSDDGRASKYPDIAVADGRAALTWFDEQDGTSDVYLVSLPIDELATGLERRASRVTATPGTSIGAYLAWNGDRIGLAWSDDTGGAYEVYFQAFDADGRAIGRMQRLTRTPTASLIPDIRPWGSGFAVVWNEWEGPGAGSQVAITIIRGR